MYTVENLIDDLRGFPLDAEVKPLQRPKDKEDGISLFEIHCEKSVIFDFFDDVNPIWVVTTEKNKGE